MWNLNNFHMNIFWYIIQYAYIATESVKVKKTS